MINYLAIRNHTGDNDFQYIMRAMATILCSEVFYSDLKNDRLSKAQWVSIIKKLLEAILLLSYRNLSWKDYLVEPFTPHDLFVNEEALKFNELGLTSVCLYFDHADDCYKFTEIN